MSFVAAFQTYSNGTYKYAGCEPGENLNNTCNAKDDSLKCDDKASDECTCCFQAGKELGNADLIKKGHACAKPATPTIKPALPKKLESGGCFLSASLPFMAAPVFILFTLL